MERTKISTDNTPKNIATALALLESAVPRLEAATAGMSVAQLDTPLVDEWSLRQILVHLLTCELVVTQRIYWMLAYLHPHDFRKVMNLERHPFARVFQDFRWRREDLLHVLTGLKPDGWARGGTLKGKPHSVYLAARNIALHNEEHCIQVEEITGLGRG